MAIKARNDHISRTQTIPQTILYQTKRKKNLQHLRLSWRRETKELLCNLVIVVHSSSSSGCFASPNWSHDLLWILDMQHTDFCIADSNNWEKFQPYWQIVIGDTMTNSTSKSVWFDWLSKTLRELWTDKCKCIWGTKWDQWSLFIRHASHTLSFVIYIHLYIAVFVS